MSKSQARAVTGTALVLGGTLIGMWGVSVLAATAAIGLAGRLGAGRIAIIPSVTGGRRRPPAASAAGGQGPPAAPAASGAQEQETARA